MTVSARFVHTSLVAEDWRELAKFYVEVLGCKPVGPERNLEGHRLEDATGVTGAHIRGVHLLLPGWGPVGPTLEIFGYNMTEDRPETATNRLGFAHIAFAVDDVQAAMDEVLASGGRAVGKVVSLAVPGSGSVTFGYCTDPEGNIIELQCWET